MQDIFGTPVSFNYPAGNSEHFTGCGALLSGMITLFTVLLSCNNLLTMATYQNSDISTSIKDSHLSYNDTFTEADGLHFAFGVPDYDSLLVDKLQLVASIVDWDSNKS